MVLGLPVISLHLSSPIFIDGSCKLKGWVGLNMWWETCWETCPHRAPGVFDFVGVATAIWVGLAGMLVNE